jgi:DNA-binding SARP family transcriptional activator
LSLARRRVFGGALMSFDAFPGEWNNGQGRTMALTIRVLGAFAVADHRTVVRLSEAPTRLIAFLALNPGPWRRAYLAGQLWPDLSEPRSLANLRNAVWRLQSDVDGMLIRNNDQIGLSDDVTSDVGRARALANALISGKSVPGEECDAITLLSSELLPDWYEDWLLFERARLKQLFLHALERLANQLAAHGRWAEALDAVLTAVAMEPLRETAHRIIFKIHQAEGNVTEAWRQYEGYRILLEHELGASPSAEFAKVAALTRRAVDARARKQVARQRPDLLPATPASA